MGLGKFVECPNRSGTIQKLFMLLIKAANQGRVYPIYMLIMPRSILVASSSGTVRGREIKWQRLGAALGSQPAMAASDIHPACRKRHFRMGGPL
jgi:hypothetical protein